MTQLEEIIHHECDSIGGAVKVLAALTDSPRPLNGDRESCWSQAMPGVKPPTLGEVAAAIVNVAAFRDNVLFIEELEHKILPDARRTGAGKRDLKSQIAAK